ncbi:MAG: recombinase family protein [Aestuariivita sp.]|nr:recombinase family protein [Aestuariivita sp.]
MLVSYARVSTLDQSPALQMDALRTADCERIFVKKASGPHRDRPELSAAPLITYAEAIPLLWKLSRLARSLKQVIKTVSDIGERGISLKGRDERFLEVVNSKDTLGLKDRFTWRTAQNFLREFNSYRNYGK